MSRNTLALTDFRRIVVKVGSSLLVDAAAGRVNETWLASLADDIGRLHREKRDILVVSSGAIALGRAVLRLPHGSLKLEDSQAAAAVGQIALARTWAEALGRHDRDHWGHSHGDRVGTHRASAARDRRKRTVHLVPDAGQSGDGAQEMDCGLARAEGYADDRCRRGRGPAPGQQPAARWHHQG